MVTITGEGVIKVIKHIQVWNQFFTLEWFSSNKDYGETSPCITEHHLAETRLSEYRLSGISFEKQHLRSGDGGAVISWNSWYITLHWHAKAITTINTDTNIEEHFSFLTLVSGFELEPSYDCFSNGLCPPAYFILGLIEMYLLTGNAGRQRASSGSWQTAGEDGRSRQREEGREAMRYIISDQSTRAKGQWHTDFTACVCVNVYVLLCTC